MNKWFKLFCICVGIIGIVFYTFICIEKSTKEYEKSCAETSYISKVDGKKIDKSCGNFHYQEWNNHRYVIWGWGYHGGVTHDPDCPYDKKEIEK